MDLTGEIYLELDARGYLEHFAAVPPQHDPSPETAEEFDWSLLFAEAGLDMELFREVPSEYLPYAYCASRRAWIGSYPEQPEPEFRIEACSYAGKPIRFVFWRPWRSAPRDEPEKLTAGQKALRLFLAIAALVLIVTPLVLARRNLVQGRGDKRGALRLACFFFCAAGLHWLFVANHAWDVWIEFLLFAEEMSENLFTASVIGMMYIALEPFVRRRWPDLLVSWNRLLAGRIRDPRIGRDFQIGAAFGIAALLGIALNGLLPGWLGWVPQRPLIAPHMALDLGVRGVMANYFWHFAEIVGVPMIVLFAVVLLRVILRKTWLALTLVALLLTLTASSGADQFAVWLPGMLLASVLALLCLVRFGIVALMAFTFFSDLPFKFPLTLDLSIWYAGQSILVLAVAAVAAIYAFIISLGGRPLFQRGLLGD
jgi:hypothetical protein